MVVIRGRGLFWPSFSRDRVTPRFNFILERFKTGNTIVIFYADTNVSKNIERTGKQNKEEPRVKTNITVLTVNKFVCIDVSAC